ncbi:MAG: class I SAM-dependent DNA methyltransferase [Methylococcales bacterium]|nr:class I SAM-dependent DNA methyltransferase [Methylococcales bacterium]
MNTEENLHSLIASLDKNTFIYDLLLAYGLPRASITRLKKGDYNLSNVEGEIIWKKKLFFKSVEDEDLHSLFDALKNSPVISKQHPRFMMLTNFKSLLATDTKTGDSLDIALDELPKHYDFFLPWAGIEKAQFQNENPADVKAAERMGRLYDLILEDNPTHEATEIHALNIFLSRLLFCFFAEDTGIFKPSQFTNALALHTVEDGGDLQGYLQKLFVVLNRRERSEFPQFLQYFPYVNGGLFADDVALPVFSRQSRKLIIECGTLNWKDINPDIFGSMIQAVVHNDQRSNMGMHYTSVVNIMKVIEPLFLNDLTLALENAENHEGRLKKLLHRLYQLRIFDPACGSGNFLIIAYKVLCRLEIAIFKQLQKIDASNWKQAVSGLHLNQFYGIELDDFAHETAKLSLWLTEHQMNLEFRAVFGEARPTLPLQDTGHIVCGNATRLDWEEVCPKVGEIYILGNPPYLGGKLQSADQKKDLSFVSFEIMNCKNLDYISCWFIKGTKYINNSLIKCAFVSTNSICQGEQVSLLWNYLFSKKIEIDFAHQSFKWTNNARGNAGITCVIVSIRNISNQPKFLFENLVKRQVKNINAYLTSGTGLIINKRAKAISNLPLIYFGNMPRDGGHLVISSEEERASIISSDPRASKFILKYLGSKEFIRSEIRYCLWIEDKDLNEASSIPKINNRILAVKNERLISKAESTKKYANQPHRFVQISYQKKRSIIIPSVSSERREYIPIGFLDKNIIVSNLAFAIYDPPTYIFAIISSRMHMTWVRAVAGRLKTDYRYSSTLCYNTFPFPKISKAKKIILEDCVFKVLDERELHPEKTIAQLYDPDKMPEGLRQAHHEMDLAIEQCYRTTPFKNDEERLEYLFKRYEKMIAAEA